MLVISGFEQMLAQIQQERGIPREALIEAIESAILSACKKGFVQHDNLRVKVEESGEAKVFAEKEIVTRVTDGELQISLKDAKKIKKTAKRGEKIDIEVTPRDLGRLAAQTAKQVIVQRLREIEKDSSFEEFKDREGELITGVVQRREYGGYLVNLGRIETFLSPSECIPGERLNPRDRVKLYIVETKKTVKGPLVVVSRSHPNLVLRLFEREIPELSEGILEIRGIAREAGKRSKVAVISKDPNVGAIGTCVGHMGSRIQNILRELGREKIDIVEWSDRPVVFIAKALSPAAIAKVLLNKEEMTAKVVVPDDQLSLAIGREGQNVRLASRLTGWKIDIMSVAQEQESEKGKAAEDKEEAKETGPEEEARSEESSAAKGTGDLAESAAEQETTEKKASQEEASREEAAETQKEEVT